MRTVYFFSISYGQIENLYFIWKVSITTTNNNNILSQSKYCQSILGKCFINYVCDDRKWIIIQNCIQAGYTNRAMYSFTYSMWFHWKYYIGVNHIIQIQNSKRHTTQAYNLQFTQMHTESPLKHTSCVSCHPFIYRFHSENICCIN